MKLTKYGHACVRLEKDGRVLVIDPGTFSDVAAALEGADAILVTHEHADHIDTARVLPVLAAEADLVLYAPASLAATLRSEAGDSASRILDAVPETVFDLAGFGVRTYGGQHALIHPHIPVVHNVGYVIDDSLYHPGDSFIVPHDVKVTTLLVPAHAPWSKSGEVIDFVIAVRPEKVYPIHDGLLNERGLALVDGHVGRFGGIYGTSYERLESGVGREV
ncbi:MBL fold metallo-hydrolase [Arthrobacter ginkgonis]|uniref:MBL fold metallo-hydrolase n=1 Tax=Arthrobacter ginkgonis TaxID=1630594 RepID=A0ABP7C7E9_9MICC